MPKALALVDDPLFLEHKARDFHPERPERLEAARLGVEKASFGLSRQKLPARDASDDELNRVHGDEYLTLLGQAAGKQGHFDADTYFNSSSVAAARRAAGGAIALVDCLLDREASHGLALLRPPGHHALSDRAMGFCILNNVAVAAAHARARGAERVFVLDWDVHHGNGTQEIFYDDPSVLYASLHQFPFYPGTGAHDETGNGEGRGYTVNVPLGAGATDAVYIAAFERILLPILESYNPDLVLVSAGFDAHTRDPLAEMSLTDAAYARMTRLLIERMPKGDSGRFGIVLEGGYDLAALAASVKATLEALDPTSEQPVPSGVPSERHQAELDRALRQQREFWPLG
jgi:acetoin utilization deacetylase AcuC-like enzyme